MKASAVARADEQNRHRRGEYQRREHQLVEEAARRVGPAGAAGSQRVERVAQPVHDRHGACDQLDVIELLAGQELGEVRPRLGHRAELRLRQRRCVGDGRGGLRVEAVGLAVRDGVELLGGRPRREGEFVVGRHAVAAVVDVGDRDLDQLALAIVDAPARQRGAQIRAAPRQIPRVAREAPDSIGPFAESALRRRRKRRGCPRAGRHGSAPLGQRHPAEVGVEGLLGPVAVGGDRVTHRPAGERVDGTALDGKHLACQGAVLACEERD